MSQKDDDRFVFGADGDEPEKPAVYKDETRSRLDNLSLRVTLIAIITPCLIGIVVVFGYLDINRRVSVFKDSGSQEVRNVTKDVERIVSALQVKNARLEKLINQTTGEMTTRLKTLETRVAKTRKDVDYIVATRYTQKQIQNRIAKVSNQAQANDNALTLIQTDLAEAIDKTRKMERQAAADTESLAHLKGEVAVLTKELETFSASLTKVADLKAAMDKERIFSKKRVDDVRFDLTRHMKNATKEYQRLGDRLDALQRQLAHPPVPAAPQPKVQPAAPPDLVEEEISAN